MSQSKTPMSAKSPTSPKKKATSKPIKPSANPKPESSAPPEFWTLYLYVAGQTPKSLMAFANLKRLCEEQLCDRYEIEVIDLLREPHRAKSDQIVALPTLVRKLPEPLKRLIGDLSNAERVKISLDMKPL